MKTLFLVLFFPVLSLALPTTGFYKGRGTWANDGGMGDVYEVDLTLKASSLFSEYFESDDIHKRAFQFSSLSENFDLYVDSVKIGEGHCKENLCEFNWTEQDDQMKEILSFNKNKIQRSGKRLSQGHWVSWQEDLDLQ